MLDLQMKGLKFMVSILITCAPLASLASGWKLWKPPGFIPFLLLCLE